MAIDREVYPLFPVAVENADGSGFTGWDSSGVGQFGADWLARNQLPRRARITGTGDGFVMEVRVVTATEPPTVVMHSTPISVGAVTSVVWLDYQTLMILSANLSTGVPNAPDAFSAHLFSVTEEELNLVEHRVLAGYSSDGFTRVTILHYNKATGVVEGWEGQQDATLGFRMTVSPTGFGPLNEVTLPGPWPLSQGNGAVPLHFSFASVSAGTILMSDLGGPYDPVTGVVTNRHYAYQQGSGLTGLEVPAEVGTLVLAGPALYQVSPIVFTDFDHDLGSFVFYLYKASSESHSMVRLSSDYAYPDPGTPMPHNHRSVWFDGAEHRAAATREMVQAAFTSISDSWSFYQTQFVGMDYDGFLALLEQILPGGTDEEKLVLLNDTQIPTYYYRFQVGRPATALTVDFVPASDPEFGAVETVNPGEVVGYDGEFWYTANGSTLYRWQPLAEQRITARRLGGTRVFAPSS